ncbi:TolC family protein [Glaciimonas immobilis]|uniref:Outer membrane protein TolC n=1 Tax=Glaciimonas immobilis TaxID=728004 RepID=A0A840RWC7_9BURK|nr:TolC family protein [Glaciimonas immobilis]MBB5202185.1 outer membrane protein TolC [Glaciimonas immobilis]
MPAALAATFEARSLDSDALHAYLLKQSGDNTLAWPLHRWNRDMLTLAAFYYSPALDIARAQWGTAKAGVDVARAIPNPVLQLPFEYSANAAGTGRPYTTGLALDIPIETAHKRGYRVDQSARLSDAARLNIATATWKVRSQVRDATLSMYDARERITFLTQKVTAQQQIFAMTQKRLAVGDASGPDVHLVEIALTQAQNDLITAQGALKDASTQLANVIGLPLSALSSIQLDFDEFALTVTVPSSFEVRRMAIYSRADLQSSLAEYEATQAALQLEIAKQYPDLHIGLGYTYDVGTNKFGLGIPGITLPLFDQNQGGIALAEAKRTEAAARTVALQDTIINALDHALGGYETSLEALNLSSTRLALAQKQLKNQTNSFRIGAIDRLTLTRYQADFDLSQIDHLNGVVAVQRAVGALEDAMQRPFVVTNLPNLLNRVDTQEEISR